AGPAQSGAMASGDEPESGGANLIGYGASEPKTRSSKERALGQKTAAAAVGEPANGTAGAPAAAAEEPAPTATVPAPTSAGRVARALAAAEPAGSPPVPAPTSGGQASPVPPPLVRKLAKDHGISAQHLPGSGAGGVVTRADVLAAIESEATVDRRVPAGTSAD